MSALDAPVTTIPSGPDELWYTRCPVPTAFEVALANGAFDAEFAGSGLTWQAIAESPDPAVHESHFTHRKASSFRHGGNIPAIYARSRGADTVVVAVSWPRTAYPVLALPESGIRTAAQLRGRRILVPRRDQDTLDFWAASALGVWESALASAGLTLDDVRVVETRNPELPLPGTGEAELAGRLRWSHDARSALLRMLIVPLVRGEVDAVPGQTVWAQELAALTGARVIYEQADQPGLLSRVNNGAPDTVTVSGELARRHPDRVARVLVRLLESAAWAKEHPDAALDVLAHRLQTPITLLQATYGDQLAGHLDVTLPGETGRILQFQQDLLLRHGFIDAPFDVEPWIDPRPLQLARELLADRGAA